MVRDPHGQGSPGLVIVQGYSWLVSALLQWLAAGLADHTAAVIWFGTHCPVVFWFSMCIVAQSIWLGTNMVSPPPPCGVT